MYSLLLPLHSAFRWLVLVSLLIAIYRAYWGWLSNRPFSRFDNRIRHYTATIAHIQLILGIYLYCISPVIDYFLHQYKDAVHERSIRFFGMEHSVMMLISIILITIGSMRTKRQATEQQRLKRWLFGLVLRC